jgi:hypothetical protein
LWSFSRQKNEEAVKAAWGDVEASYQRRSDLLPNLVEVEKAYDISSGPLFLRNE